MCTLTVPYPYRMESTPPCVINFYPWKPEAVKKTTLELLSAILRITMGVCALYCT